MPVRIASCTYLLDLGVEVEIVPVPDWSADLALDALEEGRLAGRLVPQPHLQAERRPVHHLQAGFTKRTFKKQLSLFSWFFGRLFYLVWYGIQVLLCTNNGF